MTKQAINKNPAYAGIANCKDNSILKNLCQNYPHINKAQIKTLANLLNICFYIINLPMEPVKNSNLKSLLAVTLTLMVLFGVFYYLITDISNQPSSNLSSKVKEQEKLQEVLAKNDEKNLTNNTENNQPKETAHQTNKEEAQENEYSYFAALASKKPDAQPQLVLGAADENIPESTVPQTGVEMIFFAFVASALITFYGIYLLTSQKRSAALSKFEQRIIKDLD